MVPSEVISIPGKGHFFQDQWRVGLSSFLSASLGLAPFKDVFWSSPENFGSPFYSDCMIVSNNTDPNIPWTLNYRYNGYKNVSSKQSI